MNRRLVAGLGTLLTLATACTSSRHAQNSPTPTPTETGSNVAALAPCPPTTSGGHGVLAVTLSCLGAGPKVHLAGLRGTPTIVSLWASWCSHCPEEARALELVYARASGRLRVVGVDEEDDHGHALAFLHDLGVHYPSVFDQDGNVRVRLNIPGPPATLFVNADGKVVGRIFGPLDVRRINAYIAQFLGVQV